jgi:hypothetical protein
MTLPASTWFSAFLAVVIVGTIAASLSVIENPSDIRERQKDRATIQDLESYKSRVESYWRTHKKLPTTMVTLEDGAIIQSDQDVLKNMPKQSYDYRAISPTSYELCGVFNQKTNPNRETYRQKHWDHPAGRHCFSFSVARIDTP